MPTAQVCVVCECCICVYVELCATRDTTIYSSKEQNRWRGGRKQES